MILEPHAILYNDIALNFIKIIRLFCIIIGSITVKKRISMLSKLWSGLRRKVFILEICST
jgi:hypothetical protein